MTPSFANRRADPPAGPVHRPFGPRPSAGALILALVSVAVAAQGADVSLPLAYASKEGNWQNFPVASSSTSATACSVVMSKNLTDDPNWNRSWTWSGSVTTPGQYRVRVFIPAGAKTLAGRLARPTVTYTLEAADGSHRQDVDQSDRANSWVDMGPFPFEPNTPVRLHLAANNYQLYDTSVGVDRMWVSLDQLPTLILDAQMPVARPAKTILVLSANTYMKHGSGSQWYSTFHGPSASASMASLIVWATGKNYALTEAYDGGWIYGQSLKKYDAIVINFEGSKTLNDEKAELIIAAVREGKGLVGFHAATHTKTTASTKSNRRLAQFLGTTASEHPYVNHWDWPVATYPAVPLAVTEVGKTHLSTFGLFLRRGEQTGFKDEWYLWEPESSPIFSTANILLTDADGFLSKLPTDKLVPSPGLTVNPYASTHVVSWQRNPDHVTDGGYDTLSTGRGRVWYTSMGHEITSYPVPRLTITAHVEDPVRGVFKDKVNLTNLGKGVFTAFEHILGGIEYVLGNTPSISSLTVVDTDTDQDFAQIQQDGGDLPSILPRNWSLRANASVPVDSVQFWVTSQSEYLHRTERLAPYSLNGVALVNGKTHYTPFLPPSALTKLSVKVTSLVNGQEFVSSPFTVNVTR